MKRHLIIMLCAAPLTLSLLGGCCNTHGDYVQKFNREDDQCHVCWGVRRGHFPQTTRQDEYFAFWHPDEHWESVETHSFLRATLARDHRWHDSERRVRIEREQEDRHYYRHLLYPHFEGLYGPPYFWDLAEEPVEAASILTAQSAQDGA